MRPCAILLISVMPIAAAAAGGQDASSRYLQSYGNPALRGETLMDNERLVVQKFVIPPGTWEGQHTHAGNQLWVQMNGRRVDLARRSHEGVTREGGIGRLAVRLSRVLKTTKAASIPGRLRSSCCG